MIASRIILALGYFSLQVSSSEQQTTTTNSTDKRCLHFKYYVLYFRPASADVECLGDKYTYGHQILKFWDECTIEPENTFLSYEDSHWNFYKCIVQKSLGTQQLTLTNYAELMTGNMSATTRSAILSIITTIQGQEEMESTTSADRMTTETDLASVNSKNFMELGDIRKYWDRFFEAEFQVCSSTLKNTCNQTNLDSLRTIWKSQKVCKNGNVPRKLKDKNENFEQYRNCTKSLDASHTFTNTTARDIRSASMNWCFCTVLRMDMVAREDENTHLDFEPIYNKYIVPKFYSKSVQQEVFKTVGNLFSSMYPKIKKNVMASKSIKEITSYAAKEISELYRKKGHSEENLMFLTNSRILTMLVDAGERALSSICDRGLHVE